MRYFPLLTGIVVLALLFLSSLWLDAAGQLAPGTLVFKREIVMVGKRSWSREFLVRVVYHTGTLRPRMTDLTVNEKEFDTLHIGDEVQVRYANLRLIPGTRLATRSTGTILMDFFHRFRFPITGPAHWVKANARVVRTQRVDQPWFRAPFVMVQLAYTPEGQRDPVQAVEEVNALASLPCDQVAVEYDANAPRHARLAEETAPCKTLTH